VANTILHVLAECQRPSPHPLPEGEG
jgi:hypothetical protein